MKLRSITEKQNKDFFNYDSETKDMWDDKIHEAKKEFEVDFNTENDGSMDQQRIIDIDETKFACEMYSAGGDWEFPLRYFRCEIKSGRAGDFSKHSNPHFIYIPNGNEGNGQLENDKGKWSCPDSDFKDEEKRDDKKCWDSLKKHLKSLVNKKSD